MRQNKGFLELRRLEAARDIADLLATSNNRVMLDAASLLLNGKRYMVSYLITNDWLCSDRQGCSGYIKVEEVSYLVVMES